MRILLVCAGGLSTSILMKKMEKWANENNRKLTIDAVAKNACITASKDYDCILLGPQISYSIDEIRAEVKIPVASIPPLDYAIGNAENVMKLAEKIVAK